MQHLPNHRLARGEVSYLEQTGDLLQLFAVHAIEEPDAVHGGHRVERGGAGRWRIAASLPGSDGTALEEVNRPILACPFDIAPRAVGLLAFESDLTQFSELRVVETELAYLRRRHGLLERAPIRERADGDALASGLSLQHLAGATEAKEIRHHPARDHSFPEAPAGFDQTLIGAGDRVLGEHDAGYRGIEERLDHHAHARTSEFNPYLNYHRPCGVPEEITNAKGKRRRVYRWYATPWEILRQLPDLARRLRPGTTPADLEKLAGAESDTAAALRMQEAKQKLFVEIRQKRTA
jgi:hypothetical protein